MKTRIAIIVAILAGLAVAVFLATGGAGPSGNDGFPKPSDIRSLNINN